MSGEVDVTPEDERVAAEIEREAREHPLRSALPTGRARSLYGRIVGALREHGSEIDLDEVMEQRAAQLDDAARRSEHAP